jgi:hypothetical protein
MTWNKRWFSHYSKTKKGEGKTVERKNKLEQGCDAV